MFQSKVTPYLRSIQPEMIFSRMVKICGVGESAVEEKLLDLIENQTNPTIATYAKVGEVHVRVTAKVKSEEEAKSLIKPVIKEIRSRFGDYVYSTREDETLEGAVVALLKKYGLTVTTAESCTGGMLAARLINVPGVSEYSRKALSHIPIRPSVNSWM